jgi:hypothetical protein
VGAGPGQLGNRDCWQGWIHMPVRQQQAHFSFSTTQCSAAPTASLQTLLCLQQSDSILDPGPHHESCSGWPAPGPPSALTAATVAALAAAEAAYSDAAAGCASVGRSACAGQGVRARMAVSRGLTPKFARASPGHIQPTS